MTASSSDPKQTGGNVFSRRVVVIGILAFLSCGLAEDEKYPYSIEEAKALGQSDETVYHSEFGDPEGPFRWIASSEVSSVGSPDFRARFGNGPLIEYTRVNDPAVRLEVLYFVNPAGNGFGVIFRKAAFGETLPELKKEDPRPQSHIALAPAANLALLEANYPLLEMLLKSGLDVNEPLELDRGNTLLHTAAVIDDVKAVKMLLETGADPMIRDVYGERPINPAFEDDQKEICELLRIPDDEEEQVISGFPAGMIEEAFLVGGDGQSGVVFLSFNGKDPDEALIDLIESNWIEAEIRPASTRYEISWEKAREKKTGTTFLSKEDDEPGTLIELSIRQEGDSVPQWRHRVAVGSALAGGGSEGIVQKQYGYWIAKATGSWDE